MLQRLKHTLKSTLIYSFGNISLKLVGLILLPVYTEHLEVEQYGRWALLEISSQVLVILISFRLSIAMIRFFSAEKDQRKKKTVLFTASLLSFISILIFNALLHPASSGLSNLFFNTPDLSRYFTYLIIWSSLEVMNRLTLDFIRVIQKPLFFVLAVTIRFTLVLGLNIYFVAGRNLGIEGILLGQLIGSIFLFILTMPFLVLRMRPVIDWNLMKEMTRYGMPLIVSSLSIFLLTMSDRYLIKIMLEYERVGIYSLSYKIASVVKFILIQAFQLGFIPIVFNMFDKQDFRRFVSKVFTYYTFILVFASIALSAFSKDILLLFSKSPEYLESYRYIPFMLLAFCFQGQQYVFTIGLHYVKRVSSLVWITLSTAVLNIFLNWLLLPTMGLYGSVVAVNVSSFLMAYLTYYFAQRQYSIPYEMGKIVLIFVAGIILYLLSLAVPEGQLWISISMKVLLILSFPFLLYLMRFYDPVELKSIGNIWQTWRDPRRWKKNIRRIMGEGMNDEFM